MICECFPASWDHASFPLFFWLVRQDSPVTRSTPRRLQPFAIIAATICGGPKLPSTTAHGRLHKADDGPCRFSTQMDLCGFGCVYQSVVTLRVRSLFATRGIFIGETFSPFWRTRSM